MKRRDLLKLFSVAPAVILTPGLLMPVKSLDLHPDLIAMNEMVRNWKAVPLRLISIAHPPWEGSYPHLTDNDSWSLSASAAQDEFIFIDAPTGIPKCLTFLNS